MKTEDSVSSVAAGYNGGLYLTADGSLWQYTMDAIPPSKTQIEVKIPSGIYLSTQKLTLSVNESATVGAAIYPASARSSAVLWTSSNPAAATVENGVVKATGAGEIDITAMVPQLAASASCHVLVPGIRLSETSLTMKPGETVILSAEAFREQGEEKTIRWMSTAPGVASVKDGVVEAKAAGEAAIYAATIDGAFSVSCTVSVAKGEQSDPGAKTWTITFHPNGGTVYQTTKTLTENDEIYGDLPDPARDGYIFEGWYTATEYGKRITPETKFTERANQTLYAVWSPDVPRCTVQFEGNGGKVTPSSKTVETGSVYGELPTPTRNGCAFLGWYTEPTGGERVDEETASLPENHTLYAHWRATNVPEILMDGRAVSSAREISAQTDLDLEGRLFVADAAKPDAYRAATVCCAAYDRAGRMVSWQKWDVDVSDARNIRFTGSVHIPEGVSVGSIKVMVLGENLVPLQAAGQI